MWKLCARLFRVIKSILSIFIQIGPNCWQGRYTPTIDGKRVSRNVYAPTEEECEKKLKELIIDIKEEIRAAKQEMTTAMSQMHL